MQRPTRVSSDAATSFGETSARHSKWSTWKYIAVGVDSLQFCNGTDVKSLKYQWVSSSQCHRVSRTNTNRPRWMFPDASNPKNQPHLRCLHLCIFAPTGLFCRWSQREMAKRTCTETWLHCKAVSVASEFLKFHLQTHMDSNHVDLLDPDFLFVLDLFWLKKPHLQFFFGISLNLTLYKEVQLFSSRCHWQCCLALAVSKSCHCLSIVKQIRLILKSFNLFGYLRDSPWYSWYAKDVNWLTGLNEPPQDVLDLLEFFLSRAPCREIWRKLGYASILFGGLLSHRHSSSNGPKI